MIRTFKIMTGFYLFVVFVITLLLYLPFYLLLNIVQYGAKAVRYLTKVLLIFDKEASADFDLMYLPFNQDADIKPFCTEEEFDATFKDEEN